MKTVKWLVMIFLLSFTSIVYAQESSTAAEFRHEGEKFKENCSKLELKLITGCGEQLFTGKPLHVAVGSIAPQNGMSFGPAFVKHWTPNENWKWNLNTDGVVSSNGSWRAGVYVSGISTKIKPGTITVGSYPVYRLYVQSTSLDSVAFYGLGSSSSRSNRTVFGLRETIAGGGLTYPIYKPLRLSVRGEANGRWVDIRGGSDPASPSIEQAFTETTAPGLTTHPGVMQFGENVRIRPSVLKENLQLDYSANFQQFIASDSQFSFNRMTLEFSHRIPITKRKASPLSVRDHNGPDDCSQDLANHDCPKMMTTTDRVGSIGLRMLLTESFSPTAHTVPFYFQPTLGGSDINGRLMVSSLDDYRYRAPNLLLFQGNIEHTVWGPIGVMFLAESGKVAEDKKDIKLSGLVQSFAAGLTLRAGGLPVMQIMYAWGAKERNHTIASVNTSLLGGSARPTLD